VSHRMAGLVDDGVYALLRELHSEISVEGNRMLRVEVVPVVRQRSGREGQGSLGRPGLPPRPEAGDQAPGSVQHLIPAVQRCRFRRGEPRHVAAERADETVLGPEGQTAGGRVRSIRADDQVEDLLCSVAQGYPHPVRAVDESADARREQVGDAGRETRLDEDLRQVATENLDLAVIPSPAKASTVISRRRRPRASTSAMPRWCRLTARTRSSRPIRRSTVRPAPRMSTACPPGRTRSAISTTVTSPPARASRHATAGPARPPPLTRTRRPDNPLIDMQEPCSIARPPATIRPRTKAPTWRGGCQLLDTRRDRTLGSCSTACPPARSGRHAITPSGRSSAPPAGTSPGLSA
jgi:hypothetical protein